MTVRSTPILTDDELLSRLAHHEDNFIERKRGIPKRQELRQTLCAFSNSLGPGEQGVLFIGVDDHGVIVGIQNTDEAQKNVREAAERDCYPPITNFKCNVLHQDGKAVVAVVVEFSDNRPHFTGPAYERRGSESVNASEKFFNELISGRNEKVGAILAMRGSPITVRQHVSPSMPVPDNVIGKMIALQREFSECAVEDCSAHFVRLRNIASNNCYSISLVNVEILYDENKYRPMLVIESS